MSIQQIAKLGSLVALLALNSPTLAGPAFIEQLIPDNGGLGLSMDGEWMVVGESAVCRAYVYRLDYDSMMWGDGVTAGEIYQTLDPPQGACPSALTRGYGEVVSINGNLIIVGAPEAKGPKTIERDGELLAADSGTVFIYLYNAVSETFDLVVDALEAEAPNGDLRTEEGARFGAAVSVSGSLIIIGAPTDGSAGAPNAGRGEVYVYQYDEGTDELLKLGFILGDSDFDRFGTSVTGNYPEFLVGVPGSDLAAVDAGAAYLYELQPGDVLGLIDTITVSPPFTPIVANETGIEVSMSDDLVILAGGTSYPAEPLGDSYVAKFEYGRSQGGDVSQSEGVAAFGISGTGIDIYPDVLNDNADQRSNYHMEIDLTVSSTEGITIPAEQVGAAGAPIPGLARDTRLYKDIALVNDNSNTQVRSLFFPCGYGGDLEAYEWKLVSIPCDLPPDTTVEEAFNADIFPGACDPECGALGEYGVNWEVWGQVRSGDSVPAAPPPDYVTGKASRLLTATDIVKPGQGYWIIADASLKDPGQPVYWNVDSSTSSAKTALNGGDGGFDPIPVDVRGYHQINLDPDIPQFELAKVMLGNPFPRAFDWDDVGVTVSLFGVVPFTVPLSGVNSLDPLYSATAYLYNPDSTEGQPYDTVSNAPGFNGTKIPPNTGYWLLINPSLLLTTDALYSPLEN